LTQDVARVVKTQCLVEVRSQQVMFARSAAHDASPCLPLMSKLTDVTRQTGELRHPRRVIVFHPIQNGAASSPLHLVGAFADAASALSYLCPAESGGNDVRSTRSTVRSNTSAPFATS